MVGIPALSGSAFAILPLLQCGGELLKKNFNPGVLSEIIQARIPESVRSL
jgi:hypothetical protein